MNDTSTASAVLSPTDLGVEIDLSGFLEAAGGDEKEARELLGLFLDQLGSKIPKVQSAVENGNVHDVKVLAHSLAGCSATCGLMAFSQWLRDMELAAARNDTEIVRAGFAKVSAYALPLTSAIREKLGR
jgi:HPt (histidine-containing phosphotransfer) domain-containing protein